jgi:hypothetical protein
MLIVVWPLFAFACGALAMFITWTLCACSKDADQRASCQRCHAAHQEALRHPYRAKLSANDMEWWEGEHQFVPRVKGSGGWIV